MIRDAIADEECARVSAGSGSHNLDAPYLARQRCRGKLSSHEHLWDRSPFYVAVRERREHEEQIEGHTREFTQVRAARTRKTLLLPWLY